VQHEESPQKEDLDFINLPCQFNSLDEVFMTYVGNWRKTKSNAATKEDIWKCQECSFRLTIQTKDDSSMLETKIHPQGNDHNWSDSHHAVAFALNNSGDNADIHNSV